MSTNAAIAILIGGVLLFGGWRGLLRSFADHVDRRFDRRLAVSLFQHQFRTLIGRARRVGLN